MTTLHDIIIIGSGLTGLSVAHFLEKLLPRQNIILLEKNDHPGGAIQSFRANNIQAECGPHGFLNNCEESRELLQDIGLSSTVQLAPLEDFSRFLCKNGKLTILPQHPGKFLASPLLSPLAKLRLLGDFFIKPISKDQTIAHWAGRRFGSAILPLVDAAITGTFAGDYQRLSIDSVMPGLRDLEKKYGSVFQAMRHRKKKVAGKNSGLPAMQNFPNGMEELTRTLAKDKTIHYHQEVSKINRQNDQWQVETSKKVYQGRRLVLALPVNAALKLLSPLAEPPVKEIPVARIANVVMVFGKEAEIPKGFGYLAPENEDRFCLGVMFSSAMFPDRTAHNTVLLEALVGGRRHPEHLDLNDQEIITRAVRDVSDLLSFTTPPTFTKVLRPAQGIPQLEMDHPALLTWRNNLIEKFNSLQITGFGWDGIGMNEMIKAAQKTALTMLKHGQDNETEKEVRAVYF